MPEKQAAALAAETKAVEDLWKNIHSIREVSTDQLSFIDKPFIISGAIEVSDYYNYGYREAQSTHYSFQLNDGKGICHAYMTRAKAADLRKQLLDAGGSLKGRFAVVVSGKRYDNNVNGLLLELLQFGPSAE